MEERVKGGGRQSSLGSPLSLFVPHKERICRNQISRIEPLNRIADIRVCRIADIPVGRTLASLRAIKPLTLRRLENLRHGRQECLRYDRFMGRGKETPNPPDQQTVASVSPFENDNDRPEEFCLTPKA